jgi:hypothetical protein
MMHVNIKVPKSLQFLKPFECEDYVRLGGDGDGGYIVPKFIIEMTDNLLSLGMSYEWTFDMHFQKLKPGLRVHGYDHTVSVKMLVKIVYRLFKTLCKAPNIEKVGSLYEQLLIFKNYIWFWVLKNRHYKQRIIFPPAHSYDVTLHQAIKRIQKNSSKGLFIKMDIEGSEYGLIDCLVEYAGVISGLVIEFHDIHTNRQGFISAVKQLQQEFAIVHLHGNNMEQPDESGFLKVIEISWVRKDVLPSANYRDTVYLPGIDSPNGDHRPDYMIEF